MAKALAPSTFPGVQLLLLKLPSVTKLHIHGNMVPNKLSQRKRAYWIQKYRGRDWFCNLHYGWTNCLSSDCLRFPWKLKQIRDKEKSLAKPKDQIKGHERYNGTHCSKCYVCTGNLGFEPPPQDAKHQADQ